LGRAARTYGAYSGSDSSYGFFAPSVGPQIRATFTLSDDSGRTWTDTLESRSNREVELRIGGIVALFCSTDERDALAASLAATMFGRHPEARFVTVQAESYGTTGTAATSQEDLYQLPSMANYRAGERPMWRVLYQATFTRGAEGEVTP
jgi:hypothetical protein